MAGIIFEIDGTPVQSALRPAAAGNRILADPGRARLAEHAAPPGLLDEFCAAGAVA